MNKIHTNDIAVYVSVKILYNYHLLTFNLISISFTALALGKKSLCTK